MATTLQPPPHEAVRYPSAAVLLCVCTLVGCLSFLQHHFQMLQLGLRSPFFPEIFVWLACLYPWILLAPFVFCLEHRFPINRGASHFIALALAGLFFALAASYLTTALAMLVQYLAARPSSPFARMPSPAEFFIQQFLYWVTIGNGAVIRELSRLHGRAREPYRLAASLNHAQLEMLRMRLNPHFVFNTLQNISMLTLREPRTASRMLSKLGDLLRAAYRRDYQAEIPLVTELQLTEAYLDVEKMRFGNRLSFSVEVGQDTAHALVPTFLLQPLVENAIVHGLRGSAQQLGTIGIKSARQNGQLVLTVTDNGTGVPAGGLAELETGVGLGSVSERLQGMYPDAWEFALRPLSEGGTEVRTSFPFRLRQ